jgi:hypothetical protein
MPPFDLLRGGQTRERALRALVGAVTGSGDPGVSESIAIENRTTIIELEPALNAYKAAPTVENGRELRRIASIVFGFGGESRDAFDFLALITGMGIAFNASKTAPAANLIWNALWERAWQAGNRAYLGGMAFWRVTWLANGSDGYTNNADIDIPELAVTSIRGTSNDPFELVVTHQPLGRVIKAGEWVYFGRDDFSGTGHPHAGLNPIADLLHVIGQPPELRADRARLPGVLQDGRRGLHPGPRGEDGDFGRHQGAPPLPVPVFDGPGGSNQPSFAPSERMDDPAPSSPPIS